MSIIHRRKTVFTRVVSGEIEDWRFHATRTTTWPMSATRRGIDKLNVLDLSGHQDLIRPSSRLEGLLAP